MIFTAGDAFCVKTLLHHLIIVISVADECDSVELIRGGRPTLLTFVNLLQGLFNLCLIRHL